MEASSAAIERRWDDCITAAIELGISIQSFWNLTPREIALHARARARRIDAHNQRALAIAWHIAALMRVQVLPPLGELLRAPPRPSNEELQRRAREHEQIVAAMARRTG